MSEEFISESDLAKRWGVSSRALRYRRARDQMPTAYAIGKRGGLGQGVMYKLSDVIAIEESKQVNHANPD